MTTRYISQILLVSVLLCAPSYAEPWWKKKNAATSEKTKATALVVTNGMTQSEFVAVVGKPDGSISSGSKTTLLYKGVQVQIQKGRVVGLPIDFLDQLKQGEKQQVKQDKKQKQKKKEISLAALKERFAKPKKKGAKASAPPVKKITPRTKKKAAVKPYIMKDKNGQTVDHSRYARSGRVTVIDFYADWCGPCRALAPQLDQLLKKYPDVAFQKVNIDTWGSAVSKKYHVTSVPSVRIFDRNGNMVAPPTSSIGTIEANIKRAKQ